MCIDTRECSFSTELSDLLTRHTRLGTRRRVRKISRRRQYVFSLNSTYPWVIETFARWRRNGTVTADGRSSGGSGSRKITIIEHVLDRRDIARSGRATSLSLSLCLCLCLSNIPNWRNWLVVSCASSPILSCFSHFLQYVDRNIRKTAVRDAKTSIVV